ncbi:MAG: LamG domain-containing protein [Methylococcaceae bacterium]
MFSKSKLAILASTLIIISSISKATLADLNTGIIAHWDFNDCTAKDITGSGYDGTIDGPVQCVNGINGKALSFVSTGAVHVPALPAIVNNGFSGCAWASYKDNNNWGSLFDFGNGAYADNIALIRDQTSNKLLYLYQDLNSTISGGKITNNQWQLFCVTVNNASHTAKLYANGKLVGSNTNHQIPNILRSSNFLGNNNWNEQFHGLLDEVSIWDRALSSTEINQLYIKDSPLTGNLKGSGNYTVTCTNTVTNQTITLPVQTASYWDCSAAGLQLNHKQPYHISIDGVAD